MVLSTLFQSIKFSFVLLPVVMAWARILGTLSVWTLAVRGLGSHIGVAVISRLVLTALSAGNVVSKRYYTNTTPQLITCQYSLELILFILKKLDALNPRAMPNQSSETGHLSPSLNGEPAPQYDPDSAHYVTCRSCEAALLSRAVTIHSLWYGYDKMHQRSHRQEGYRVGAITKDPHFEFATKARARYFITRLGSQSGWRTSRILID